MAGAAAASRPLVRGAALLTRREACDIAPPSTFN